MDKKQANYLSYLLRMWQEEYNGQLVWRASLEVPGPGDRRAFASLEALFDFLRAQTGVFDAPSLPGEEPTEA